MQYPTYTPLHPTCKCALLYTEMGFLLTIPYSKSERSKQYRDQTLILYFIISGKSIHNLQNILLIEIFKIKIIGIKLQFYEHETVFLFVQTEYVTKSHIIGMYRVYLWNSVYKSKNYHNFNTRFSSFMLHSRRMHDLSHPQSAKSYIADYHTHSTPLSYTLKIWKIPFWF